MVDMIVDSTNVCPRAEISTILTYIQTHILIRSKVHIILHHEQKPSLHPHFLFRGYKWAANLGAAMDAKHNNAINFYHLQNSVEM